VAKAVIVDGVRSPFHKAFGALAGLDTIALGVQVVRALLQRRGLAKSEIDAVVWGGVVLPPGSPNIAREITLDAELRPEIECMTVSRACASGLSAITTAAAMIERGDAEVVLAGGSDSTSNAAVTLPPAFVQKLGPVLMSGKRGPAEVLAALSKLNWAKDVFPAMPKVAERSTGETMGQSAEKMAERNGITREAQDAFAVQSHLRAARAVREGRFQEEVCSVLLPNGETVVSDGLIRGDTSLEKLAKLKPAFRSGGTITAGNASPLTDGACAVLLMSEHKARALGYTPRAAFRSWAYVGVDPRDQLLIGPALAMPKALAKAGLELGDVDFVDLHEAFAAQCLSVLQALGSEAFAVQRLGRSRAVGAPAPERLNVHGGSLAIGHPFAATGARMVMTMSNELVRTGKQTALLGLCAAGGLGAAAVLERV
jgi:acetyl-CoA acyltransferase